MLITARGSYFEVKDAPPELVADIAGIRQINPTMHAFTIDQLAVLQQRAGLPLEQVTRGQLLEDPQLREYQREGVRFLVENLRRDGGALLSDSMGLGKAISYSTLVRVANKWIQAGDIRVGDMVMGRDGRPTKVTGRFEQGEKQLYRVTFADGTFADADAQHLWAVQTASWRFDSPEKFVVKTTEDIAKDLKSGPNAKWFIPMLSAPAYGPEAELPLHPYLLGVLLGDGSLSRTPIVHFNLTNKAGIPDALSKLLPGEDSIQVRPGRSEVASITGTRTRDALEKLGLLQKRSWEKFVPEPYLFASAGQRLALLQGLLDTDGWCSAGSTCFGSSSEALRDAVVELVQSLGGIATKGLKPEPKYPYKGEILTGRPCYLTTIRLPSGINPFRIRAGEYVHKTKYQPSRAIVSIEPSHKELAVCFSVDAPDHLYVLGGYVVTHNTLQTIRAWEALNYPTTLVCCPASVRLTWKEQFYRWARVGLMFKVVEDGKQAATIGAHKPHVVITSYELARKLDPLFTPQLLVMDEAHLLAGRGAARSRNMLETGKGCAYRIALTGTPMWSRPRDLWMLLRILFRNYRFGSADDFDYTYCGASINKWGGKENKGSTRADELALRLRYVSLRRTKEEVAKELPPLTRTVRWIPATKEAKKALEAFSLHQMPLHEALAATLRGKMDEAMELASQLKKFLLFTWQKEHAHALYQQLNDEGTPCELVTGDLTHAQRQQAVERARAQGTGIVATIDSCSTGVDGLQHVASDGIFHALDYTPTKLAQAEARLHRIGQTLPITWTYLAMKDSADDLVIETIVSKLDQWTGVVGADTTGALADSFTDGDAAKSADDALKAIYEAMGNA